MFTSVKFHIPTGKERIELQNLLEKYVILHLKLFTDLLENHPYSFLVVMKECLQFICWLCFTPEGTSLIFQRSAIFALNILKQVILCPEYKPSKHDQGKFTTASIYRQIYPPEMKETLQAPQ